MTAVAVKRELDFSLERLEGFYAQADRIVFRHDVDYDPECALRMAEVEAAHQVRAAYYVMARSSDYNPFSPLVREILRAISALGHELAIHVDLELPREAETTNATLHYASQRDHRLLAASYSLARKVSFHAPPRSVYWRDVVGFEHALAPHWRDRHISDSRGVFRESPEQLLETPGVIQLSLHPEWWFWPIEKADEWRIREAAKP